MDDDARAMMMEDEVPDEDMERGLAEEKEDDRRDRLRAEAVRRARQRDAKANRETDERAGEGGLIDLLSYKKDDPIPKFTIPSWIDVEGIVAFMEESDSDDYDSDEDDESDSDLESDLQDLIESEDEDSDEERRFEEEAREKRRLKKEQMRIRERVKESKS